VRTVVLGLLTGVWLSACGGSSSSPQFAAFEFRSVGKCVPQANCAFVVQVTADGRLYRSRHAEESETRLMPSEVAELAAFLGRSDVLQALRAPACSSATEDTSHAVQVSYSDGLVVPKELNGCFGEPYSSLETWINKLQMYPDERVGLR
jgi:hypothetical protein